MRISSSLALAPEPARLAATSKKIKRFLPVLALAAAPLCYANHPLITEDTGVIGTGRWQLELHGERQRDGGTRASGGAAMLSYGVTPNADLQAELPYTFDEGRGDLALGLKWRFLERDALSFVAKPVLYLPTGDHSRGLGAGRSRLGGELIAAYEWGRLEFLGHTGYVRNRNLLGEREALRHLSASVLWLVREDFWVAIDVSRDTNPDPTSDTALRYAVLGASYAISKDIDLGFGYRKGVTDPAVNRAMLLGVKVRW